MRDLLRIKLSTALLLFGVPQLCAQSILGTVTDETSKQPVAAVAVSLVNNTGDLLRTVSTDDKGRFVVIAPTSGSYRLRTDRLGYHTAQTAYFSVAADETVTLDIALPVNAVELAPINVERARKIPAMLEDFYARKNRRLTSGVFFDRAEIERRNPQRLTDLLGEVPGLEVSGGNSAGGHAVHVRRQNTLQDCPLKVFVDGRQYRMFDASGLDTFSPDDLDGIEIYKGISELPAEFAGDGSSCGVLALWTKRSNVPYQTPHAERGTEFRFIAALTATILLALLGR